MTSREQYIESVKNMPRMLGKKYWLDFIEDKRLSPLQAIWAHCYECQGGYSDGAADCLSDVCMLRPFMPYNPNRIKAHVSNRYGNVKTLAKIRADRIKATVQEEESA